MSTAKPKLPRCQGTAWVDKLKTCISEIPSLSSEQANLILKATHQWQPKELAKI